MVDEAYTDVINLHRPIKVLRSLCYSTGGQVVPSRASIGPDPRARCGTCFVSSMPPVWLLSCAMLPVGLWSQQLLGAALALVNPLGFGCMQVAWNIRLLLGES